MNGVQSLVDCGLLSIDRTAAILLTGMSDGSTGVAFDEEDDELD